MSVDIFCLGGEWEFSAEEILKRKNVLDFEEEGTFFAEKVTKEKGTWAFWVWGTWVYGWNAEASEAILEVVLDVQELPPEPPEYPMTCLEKEKLPQEPEEMTAGEILSLPWSYYQFCLLEWCEGGDKE